MKKKLTLRPLPADFADRYPDGDYTVGRGADPRGEAERMADAAAKAVPTKKARKAKSRKTVTRTAAE